MCARKLFPFMLALLALLAGPSVAAEVGSGLEGLSSAKPAEAKLQFQTSEKVCVLGFSKDFGALRLNQGTWDDHQCLVPDVASCKTLTGNNASAGGFFFTDSALCQNTPCDEAPDLDGRFESIVDVRVRLQDPCKARGAWEGTFRLLDEPTQTILLASGKIEGTLGVGTHREENATCEGCHVARFDSFLNAWLIHSEGFISGNVLQGPHAGCELRASFQGQFTANGDALGPQAPNYSWGFEGKADGVLLCPCE